MYDCTDALYDLLNNGIILKPTSSAGVYISHKPLVKLWSDDRRGEERRWRLARGRTPRSETVGEWYRRHVRELVSARRKDQQLSIRPANSVAELQNFLFALGGSHTLAYSRISFYVEGYSHDILHNYLSPVLLTSWKVPRGCCWNLLKRSKASKCPHDRHGSQNQEVKGDALLMGNSLGICHHVQYVGRRSRVRYWCE